MARPIGCSDRASSAAATLSTPCADAPSTGNTSVTLTRPAVGGYVTEGKQGIHSEHLGFLLAEMQSLARAHPNGIW